MCKRLNLDVKKELGFDLELEGAVGAQIFGGGGKSSSVVGFSENIEIPVRVLGMEGSFQFCNQLIDHGSDKRETLFDQVKSPTVVSGSVSSNPDPSIDRAAQSAIADLGADLESFMPVINNRLDLYYADLGITVSDFATMITEWQNLQNSLDPASNPFATIGNAADLINAAPAPQNLKDVFTDPATILPSSFSEMIPGNFCNGNCGPIQPIIDDIDALVPQAEALVDAIEDIVEIKATLDTFIGPIGQIDGIHGI